MQINSENEAYNSQSLYAFMRSYCWVQALRRIREEASQPFRQTRAQIVLLQRVDAFALCQAQIFDFDHSCPESAVAQRQVVLPHEVFGVFPFAAVYVEQQKAVYGVVFLQHCFYG